MVEDFPVQGLDYDVAAVAIRCRADRFGAQVFRAKQTNGTKDLRVLAFDRDEVQQTADRWVHEPIYVSRPPVPSEPSPSYPRGLQACAAAGPSSLPQAHERRLIDILVGAASEAAAKANPTSFIHWWDYRKHLEAALLKSIPKLCKLLLEAASVSDARIKAQRAADEITRTAQAEVNELLKKTRHAVARELAGTRTKLRRLKSELAAVEKALLPFVNGHCERHEYGLVPGPIAEASRLGQGLPAVPGIYFVWNGGRVVYVGQSVRLSGRCILGSHHAILPGDMLSWVEELPARLNFAESFYIGILKPERNFGLRARRLVQHEPPDRLRTDATGSVNRPSESFRCAESC